jgi:hypothetical protein
MQSSIIVRVLGGLGNQMFQYAAGIAMAQVHGARALLHLEDLNDRTSHGGYALARTFGLQAPEATRADLQSVLGIAYSLRRVLLHRKARWLRGQRIVTDPHFAYWDGLRAVRPPYYLAGYWQSPRYFAGHEQSVRAAFAFPWEASPAVAALARHIQSCEAVSVHVRRGDYVTNPGMARLHGVLPLDYYERALRTVAERVERPTYFVFSDDTAWARANLRVAGETHFVGAEPRTSAREDLRLMTLCRHHIIANSTFSWWGAWLATNPQAVVCAPLRWFAGDQQDVGTLFPPGWIRV